MEIVAAVLHEPIVARSECYAPPSMRQVYIARAGGPECLEVRESPDPEPAAGEVRIRVRAAGVNFADVMGRMGLYADAPPIPYVPGYEVAGEIDRVGAGVALREGQRVLAFTRFGGYADVVCVSPDQVMPIAGELSFDVAAALPVQYLTAYHMVVQLGSLRTRETLFVHSLGGGVGIAALQLGLHAGARVMGTASPAKHEGLLARGATRVFTYGDDLAARVRDATGGHGAHVVLDPIGGRSFRESYRMLAPAGRLFFFGFSAMVPGKRRNYLRVLWEIFKTPLFHPIGLMNANRGVAGVNMAHLWSEVALLRSEMDRILALVSEGVLTPHIAARVPLEKAPEAHAILQDRKNVGKVLLTTD